MFYIYPHVLFLVQVHWYRSFFLDADFQDFCVVVHDGLDACIVNEVLHDFVTGSVNTLLRRRLLIRVESEEILHIDMNVMYQVII